ncbi:MAG: hypothetical protein Kow00121_30580 [Elainellaceae cyanobacterium]
MPRTAASAYRQAGVTHPDYLPDQQPDSQQDRKPDPDADGENKDQQNSKTPTAYPYECIAM